MTDIPTCEHGKTIAEGCAICGDGALVPCGHGVEVGQFCAECDDIVLVSESEP